MILPGTPITPDRTPHFKRYLHDEKIVGFIPGTVLEERVKLYFKNKYQIELQTEGEPEKAPEPLTDPKVVEKVITEPTEEKPVVKPVVKVVSATPAKALTGKKPTKVAEK